MEPAVTLNKRLVHVDLLKCLAIYFVLVFHGTLYNFVILKRVPVTHILRLFSRTILSTCVPLFFFVNGYLLLPKPLDLKRHTLRTGKLMLQTCFWMVFLLLVLQPFYGEYYTWEQLKETCWQLKNGWNNQLWFLEVLIGIYLVFPLLKGAWDSGWKSFCWFAAVAALLVFGNDLVNLGVTLFDLFVKKEFSLHQNDLPVFHSFNPFNWNFLLGLAYFCLGGVVYLAEERLLRISERWRNLAAAMGMVLCCFMLGMIGWRFSLYRKETWDVVWNGYSTVFTLGNVLCLYVLSLNLKREILLVRVISANTLGIYLIHDLIHKVLTDYVIQFSFMRTLTGTLVYAAVLLLISLGICLVLKKLPLVKHLIT